MKKLLFIIFFILSINIVSAKTNLITSSYQTFFDYSKESEKVKESIKNKVLTFETNTWTINCNEKLEKCSIETPWIYIENIIISTKLNDKTIKSEYFLINKLDLIIESLEFKNDKTLRKDNEFLYSYKNAPEQIKEIIKSGGIYIVSEKWDIKCLNENCFINTKWLEYGKFLVKIKTKNTNLKVLNYKIKKYSEKVDISDSFPYKRLQKYSLSCEIRASADIISAIKWKKIEEDELLENLEKTNFFDKKAIKFKWEYLWWNPNYGFVWAINNAKQSEMTWYWVLETPISVLYKKYNISNKIITKKNYNFYYSQNQHLIELFIELNKWNFVQLWWDYTTNPEEDDWIKEKVNQNNVDSWLNWKNYSKNWNKNRLIAWNYMENWELFKHIWLNWEHAFYLLWYEWEIDNPKKIIVWDTLTWKHTYNAKEWLRKWNIMDNRSIIVYK